MSNKYLTSRLFEETKTLAVANCFKHWRACCAYFLNKGYSYQEAKAILSSDVMRHIVSNAKVSSKPTSKDIERFKNSNELNWIEMTAKVLIKNKLVDVPY